MSEYFSIGVIQTAVNKDSDSTCDQYEELITKTAHAGAQIICIQELCNSKYFCSTEDHRFFDLAEAHDGPLVTRFRKLAKSLSIALVIPFFERRAAGVYHNSAAIIDADGSLLGVYRKMHIPDDPLYYEKFYFAPGDTEPGYQVFTTRYGRVGVLICWDQWYPEASRITSLMGAEVIFYPTAIGWHPSEKEEFGQQQKAAWQTIQRSHAIANGVYVAAANRVGFEETENTDGIEFFGGSFICDPFGNTLAEASDAEDFLVAKCERKKIEETRQLWPFLRDRRIDSYTQISKRWVD
jgi:N-carbamoylputrescine amidase